MENQIKYKDYFTVIEYYTLVNELTDGFFSEDGTYAPHVGDMNAMLMFFNNCIENKDVITDKEVVDDPLDADEVFANNDFIEAFNEAIFFDGEIKYDFANAFKSAMEIVQYRVNSFQFATNQLLNGFRSIVDNVNSVMNEDTINSLTEFAQNVSNGKYDAKAVADAFAESEAFKKIAEMERSE